MSRCFIRCFYFGCWNEAGHYLFAPGKAWHAQDAAIVYYTGGLPRERRHLDGSLAPRRLAESFGGGLCWAGQGVIPSHPHLEIEYRSGEYPQGQYLLHHLDNGFSAVQWWDRNQGDTRGACNSTILLEGEHTAEEVLAAGRENFPHVFANLAKAGVELVEVKK
jgi:hypothetical protein